MTLLWLVCMCGCGTFDRPSVESCGNVVCQEPESNLTLLKWAVMKADNEEKENDRNGDELGARNDPRSKPLQSDRPDFTEASTTVGKGVVQFEGGYTYTRDREGNTTTTPHSYPQSLLRIGLFADWFEFRLGQDFSDIRTTGEVNSHITGAEDTYLGIKLALTEQAKFLPETALILQATIPTGHSSLTADLTLPGINFLFSWEVIKDKIDIGGSLQVNKAVDDLGSSYFEIAQSLTVGYTLTERLGAYTEWYALYPSGALSPNIGPQYYFDGGFTYKVTKNIQFDINAGIGLNREADDYFIGSGIVLRF